MESLEGRVLLAGVTFVTHGYQAGGSFPAWVSSMVEAIAQRAGPIGTASTTMRMTVDDDGDFAGLQRLSSTHANSTTRAETMIALDWADASNNFLSFSPFEAYVSSWQAARESLVPFLNPLPASGAASPFAEVPIHLIGHSRGAAVVDDLAEQLGRYGIWVDQVTYLDAYPLPTTASDTVISAKNNILFADSYNQTEPGISNLEGEPVATAANTNLNGRGLSHTTVHTFYHGTIQPSATSVLGGNAIQSSWYTSPRSDIGFRFSRLGGGDRTSPAVSAGLLASLGGSAVRPEAPRDATVAQWPNVANLRLGANRVLNQNATTTLSFAFADRDSASNLRVFLDNDDNPYNGTVKEVTSRTLASTSFGTDSVTIDGVGLAPGSYYVGAEVNDGGRRRFAYAQDQVTMQYRLYFPEGNTANGKAEINEYLPMVNPNDYAVNYEVIARYETGVRDQVIATGTLPPLSRGGPIIYEGNKPQQSLVRFDSPYALEVRSSGPLGATMSHYDLGVGTGEAFTSQTSQTWTFPSVRRSPTDLDFIVWYNPTDTAATITITARTPGGTTVSHQASVEALRRGGISFNDATWAPLGDFSVSITSSTPLVAALSHYEPGIGQGFISLGDPVAASTSGALPFVDPTLSTTERFIITNPGSQAASIRFGTQVEGRGETPSGGVRVIPPGGSIVVLGSQIGLPRGQRGLVRYSSDQAVSVLSSTSDNTRNDALGTTAISQRARKWAFSDGYMPNYAAGIKLIEHLTLVNDNETLAKVNIDVISSHVGKTTIWADVPARSSRTFNLHTEDAVLEWGRRYVGSPEKPGEGNFFGLYVDSDLPIGASMVHWDMNQMGGWQSLGTPIGPLTRT
jgi:hypothetical protein